MPNQATPYGSGDLFMLARATSAGKVGSAWHTPAHGPDGKRPVDGFYITSCGEKIAEGAVKTLCLPFAIADMPKPKHICKRCTV
jgi:hypothetical protein